MDKIVLAAAALFLLSTAWFGWQDFQETQTQALPWMNTIVTLEEAQGLEWVKANTPERTVFVTDIFSGEFLMGRTLREGVEGGDWAIIPNVVERMSDVQYRFYESNSSAEAHATAKKYGAEYAWVPTRQIFAGYAWKFANRQVFEDERFFEEAFKNKGVTIYRVK